MSATTQPRHKPPIQYQGIRKLKLRDLAPRCEIVINKPLYTLTDLVKDKKVIDIGCGFGSNKAIVEAVHGEWIGIEPFEGGNHTVIGDAQHIPFPDCTFDVAIMDAVLEHVPEVEKAFREVARVLKPGGLFIGYSAFMECFHEISYSHLSFKALEHYAAINGMELRKIGGGKGFGTDYHFSVLMYPIPTRLACKMIASWIRGMMRLKSFFAYLYLRLKRKQSHPEAKAYAYLYYQVECLRQSNGFDFIIVKEK